MLAQLVIFLILMLLVSRFALRPLLATMRTRQDHIDDQIKSAEQHRLEAEKFVEDQKAALQQAREEAKEIVERAKVQKEREAEEIIRLANERAGRLMEEATNEINREKEKALAALRLEVGELSVQLATKLLGQELDQANQSKLVHRYLEQVGRIQ
ncbi:F0F1 ATP synthase subunit B [Shimazuella sp. KC615]|jgi:F-type H+-transporting ATPase subunit b|uniref:ATP synthase subunit b n=2 Tax=Shimazuella alba TaxID=2690964 RepID=A0A6I4VSM1_9BACL|nr:F0F1 ATP synthase subunit B [Shimazuella alba]